MFTVKLVSAHFNQLHQFFVDIRFCFDSPGLGWFYLPQVPLPVRRSSKQQRRPPVFMSHPVKMEEPSPPNNARRGGSVGVSTTQGRSFLEHDSKETPWTAVSILIQTWSNPDPAHTT